MTKIALFVFGMVTPLILFAQDAAPAVDVTALPLTAKIVLVAGIVSAVIKGLRELLDKFGIRLAGRVAVGLNVAGAAALFLGTAEPGALLSVGSIAALVGVVLAAAGMHDLGTFLRGLFAPKTS